MTPFPREVLATCLVQKGLEGLFQGQLKVLHWAGIPPTFCQTLGVKLGKMVVQKRRPKKLLQRDVFETGDALPISQWIGFLGKICQKPRFCQQL